MFLRIKEVKLLNISHRKQTLKNSDTDLYTRTWFFFPPAPLILSWLRWQTSRMTSWGGNDPYVRNHWSQLYSWIAEASLQWGTYNLMHLQISHMEISPNFTIWGKKRHRCHFSVSALLLNLCKHLLMISFYFSFVIAPPVKGWSPFSTTKYNPA